MRGRWAKSDQKRRNETRDKTFRNKKNTCASNFFIYPVCVLLSICFASYFTISFCFFFSQLLFSPYQVDLHGEYERNRMSQSVSRICHYFLPLGREGYCHRYVCVCVCVSVNTITRVFCIWSSPNLVGLLICDYVRSLFNDVMMTSSQGSRLTDFQRKWPIFGLYAL